MGVRYMGQNEPVFKHENAWQIITLLTLIVCLFATMMSIYFVGFTDYVGTRRIVNLMLPVLSVSLIHQIISITILYSDTPAILDWFVTWMGVWLLMSCAIAHTEIFGYFTSLSTFWTRKRIQIVQILIIVFHFICFLREFVMLQFMDLYAGSKMPDSFAQEHQVLFLYGHGISIYSGTVSIYYTIQSLYLIKLIHKYFKSLKNDKLKLRLPHMIKFVGVILVGTLFDWIGIAFYTSASNSSEFRAFTTMGICFLYLHAAGVPLIFRQLKAISIVKDEDALKMEKDKVVLLRDLLSANDPEIRFQPTIRVLDSRAT